WKSNSLQSWVGPVFVTCWALFWLYLHNFPFVFRHINSLVGAYRQGHYEVVEGPVQVLHEQPATGHTKGDIITVNGKQFEVNYFYLTPAYHNTLAHGGVLGGAFTRAFTIAITRGTCRVCRVGPVVKFSGSTSANDRR